MIILRTGEERRSYRILMVKRNEYSETKFAVQQKVKFLYFFTKWKFVEDQAGDIRLFESNKNANAYINSRCRWA